MNALDTKICSKCKVEKPLSEFQKSSINNDGYQNYCKICNSKKAGMLIAFRELKRDIKRVAGKE